MRLGVHRSPQHTETINRHEPAVSCSREENRLRATLFLLRKTLDVEDGGDPPRASPTMNDEGPTYCSGDLLIGWICDDPGACQTNNEKRGDRLLGFTEVMI